MIKRNDLAKQFELVVQQEITNYNNSLNHVLATLKDLQDQITDHKEKTRITVGALVAKNQELKSQIECLETSHAIKIAVCNSQINDLNISHEISTIKHDGLSNYVEKKIRLDEHWGTFFDNLNEKVSDYEFEFRKSHESTNQSINHVVSMFRKEILIAKNEILDMPSDIADVKQDLEAKLATYKIDSVGILRALELHQHETMVLGKKIENIYTLIERLKPKGDDK